MCARRHGNRLDAADKRWHLTSPTPYDPPLTYGGWLQARLTGNQISNYLEQAKIDAESPSSPNPQRKRFKVVIHSSPFLRCLQTSIAIASGLSQTSGETSLQPSEILVPIATPPAKKENDYRSSILRVDSFLGEWLSHEYFENITPPPSSNLMLGSAKVELLRNENYSMYTDFATAPQPPRKSSLWNGSPSGTPTPSENDYTFNTSSMTGALPGSPGEKKGYNAPRAMYAVSSAGKIPEGFVAHARDQCTSVDYAWDSLREPNGFGDGGTLGEEWTAMHKRFRRGLKKALNWYATTERPDKLSEQNSYKGPPLGDDSEDVETVMIVVSHGAGCNALIGAITHQPVLMDVAIASITMAVRKPNLDYDALRQKAAAEELDEPGAAPLVPVDQLYDIRLSASTDHLRSSSSTPVSSRSPSVANNGWSVNTGARGRTATLGSSNLTQFTYNDPLLATGSRSTSANAAFVGGVGTSFKRDTAPSPRPAPKQSAIASVGGIFGSNNGVPGGPPISTSSPSTGLWSPAPSSLRIMDDGKGDDQDDYDFVDFNRTRFKPQTPQGGKAPALSQLQTIPTPSDPTPTVLKQYDGPRLAGPIKLQTSWDNGQVPQEVTASAMHEEAGPAGLWGRPRSPDRVEVSRESTASKRRWTINEQTR